MKARRVIARSFRSARANGGAAFTLLELLVAVTITLLLAGLTLSVVTNTLTLWRRTQDNAATAAQARLALDLIERDLQAAVFRADGGVWLAVDVINDRTALTNHGWLTAGGLIKPGSGESRRVVPEAGGALPVIAAARFGLSGAWLRFVTTHLDATGSVPVALAYQVVRRPVSGSVSAGNPAGVRYSLFRSAVNPTGTLAGGNDVTAAAYGSASGTPAGTRQPATLTNPHTGDVLATNVADFGVWLYARDASGGLRRIFPADSGDFIHRAGNTGAPADAARFPDSADVMIRLLTETGAVLLAEIERGGRVLRPSAYANDAEWWWGVVEANSRVYTRRIELNGGGR